MIEEYDDDDDVYDDDDPELTDLLNLDDLKDRQTFELIEKFKYLGKYSSAKTGKLGSGFSENEHKEKLESLIGYLGIDFPIPVLEEAVKHYRKRRKAIESLLIEQMFKYGAEKITFPNGETYTKDYDLNVEVKNKELYYKFFEDQGYNHIIKTNFSFGREIGKEAISKAANLLLENGINFVKDESVNGMTAKSTMKKIYEKGVIPNEEVATVSPTTILKYRNGK